MIKSNDKKSWHSQLLVATPYLVDCNICSHLCVWSSWVCVDPSALILRLACLNCLWVAVCRPTGCLERTEWLGYVYWFCLFLLVSCTVFSPFFILPLTIIRLFYCNFVVTFGMTSITRGLLHKSRISPPGSITKPSSTNPKHERPGLIDCTKTKPGWADTVSFFTRATREANVSQSKMLMEAFEEIKEGRQHT